MNLYPCTKEVVRAELENTVFRMLVFMTCLLCCQMSNISMIVARFGCCTAFIGHKMVTLSISVYIFIYAYSHLFMYYCTHCTEVREHTAITAAIFVHVYVSRLCPKGIFRATQPFVTKLGMVVHHCEPECPVKIKK